MRAVLDEALLLGGGEILHLRGGFRRGLGERRARGVEGLLAASDVGLEVVDDSLVRAVLDEALLLGGGELLELDDHRSNLFLRLVLRFIHLFLDYLKVLLEVLDDFVVGCSATDSLLLLLLELLDVSVALRGGLGERRGGLVELALEVLGARLAVGDELEAGRVLADARLLLLLKLLDVGVALHGGLGERRGGLVELALQILSARLAVGDELEAGRVLADARLLLLLELRDGRLGLVLVQRGGESFALNLRLEPRARLRALADELLGGGGLADALLLLLLQRLDGRRERGGGPVELRLRGLELGLEVVDVVADVGDDRRGGFRLADAFLLLVLANLDRALQRGGGVLQLRGRGVHGALELAHGLLALRDERVGLLGLADALRLRRLRLLERDGERGGVGVVLRRPRIRLRLEAEDAPFAVLEQIAVRLNLALARLHGAAARLEGLLELGGDRMVRVALLRELRLDANLAFLTVAEKRGVFVELTDALVLLRLALGDGALHGGGVFLDVLHGDLQAPLEVADLVHLVLDGLVRGLLLAQTRLRGVAGRRKRHVARGDGLRVVVAELPQVSHLRVLVLEALRKRLALGEQRLLLRLRRLELRREVLRDGRALRLREVELLVAGFESVLQTVHLVVQELQVARRLGGGGVASLELRLDLRGFRGGGVLETPELCLKALDLVVHVLRDLDVRQVLRVRSLGGGDRVLSALLVVRRRGGDLHVELGVEAVRLLELQVVLVLLLLCLAQLEVHFLQVLRQTLDRGHLVLLLRVLGVQVEADFQEALALLDRLGLVPFQLLRNLGVLRHELVVLLGQVRHLLPQRLHLVVGQRGQSLELLLRGVEVGVELLRVVNLDGRVQRATVDLARGFGLIRYIRGRRGLGRRADPRRAGGARDVRRGSAGLVERRCGDADGRAREAVLGP